MRARGAGVLLLALTRDGRLVNPRTLDTLEEQLPTATDCFLFCHGWLVDQAEARAGAARFFSLLDGALQALGDRVVPLRVAVHWPSKPFAEPEGGSRSAMDEVSPELLGSLRDLVRMRPWLIERLIASLCEAEVPLAPEEEIELDALRCRLREGAPRGGSALSALHALSFWVMKRRAGQVGERLGRELLAPAFTTLGDRTPRLHLIGHSFGAKLLASAVLGGLRPESLVLLQAAFSAFAFAEAVPSMKRPGFYHRVLAERLVTGRIVALRSDHDRALGALYPAVTWGGQVNRATPDQGRLRHVREEIARSAMGAVGARGVGAPELDLVTTQRTGIPRSIVTIDGSRVVTRNDWLIGAHCDIYHDEIATLVLMAAGLLQGGLEGPRPRPVSSSFTLA
jgi:hypothetical protein